VRIMCVFLVNVSMNCWCLLEPSSAFTVTVCDKGIDNRARQLSTPEAR
jgi:hypothetical protein